jgi:hypothetical protein
MGLGAKYLNDEKTEHGSIHSTFQDKQFLRNQRRQNVELLLAKEKQVIGPMARTTYVESLNSRLVVTRQS